MAEGGRWGAGLGHERPPRRVRQPLRGGRPRSRALAPWAGIAPAAGKAPAEQSIVGPPMRPGAPGSPAPAS